MKQKIITYEIDKGVLWKFTEEHDFEKGSGYATNKAVFRGTRKECEKEKRRLEKNDRTNKRIRKGNSETSRRNL